MAGETRQLTQDEMAVLSAVRAYPSLHGAIRLIHEALQTGYAEALVTVHRHQVTGVEVTLKNRIKPDGSGQLVMEEKVA